MPLSVWVMKGKQSCNCCLGTNFPEVLGLQTTLFINLEYLMRFNHFPMTFDPQVSETGVHRPPVAGIHGKEDDGAYSIVLSGGYEDDHVSSLFCGGGGPGAYYRI